MLSIGALLTLIACEGNGTTGNQNLNHQGVNETGIPAWLATGMEVYQGEIDATCDINASEWYSEATSEGLPSIGDEWFIPGFIDDPLVEGAACVAYEFVRHLSEMDELERLTNLYEEAYAVVDATLTREAEQLRAELWADFVDGEVNPREVIFQAHFGNELGFYGRLGFEYPVEISFQALAERGWYFFTPGWSRDVVENYIEAGEESIYFVGDWLGYHPEEPLIAILWLPPYSPFASAAGGGGYAFGNGTGFFAVHDGLDRHPSVFTHEVVHAIVDLHPDMERGGLPFAPANTTLFGFDGEDFVELDYAELDFSFNGRGYNHIDEIWNELEELAGYLGFEGMSTSGADFFEEGLCVALEYLFLTQVESEWYIENRLAHLSNRSLQRGASREEIIGYVHERALQDMNFHDFDDVVHFGEHYGVLQEYYTAGSFILYLLEYRGTREDFLRIYSDFTLMGEVYGVTMTAMIESWLEYLDNL